MGFEFTILDFIQTLRTPALDVIVPILTKFGDAGIFWMVVIALLLCFKKTRKIGFIAMVSLALEFITCNLIVKPLVNRVRPCDVNTAIELLIKHPIDASFPSGHTAASFTCAFSFAFAKSKKLAIPSFVLATIIALTRLYLYVHYPTDVLGGICFAFFAAFFGSMIAKKLMEKWENKQAEKLNHMPADHISEKAAMASESTEENQ